MTNWNRIKDIFYNSYDKLGDRYDSAKEEEKQYEMYKHS